MERIATDGGHTVGDVDVCQIITTVERTFVNGGYAIGKNGIYQNITVVERTGADGGHTVGNVISRIGFCRRVSDQSGHRVVEQYTVLGRVGHVIFRNDNGRKTAAILENILTDTRHTGGEGNAFHGGTTVERVVGNGGHTVSEIQVGQFAAIERVTADGCHAVGEGDTRRTAASVKRVVADTGHTVGNDQVGYQFSVNIQFVGIIERGGQFVAKGNRTPSRYVGSVYARDFFTALKRTVTNGGYTRRNGDARQGFAVVKCPRTDFSHTVAKRNARQSATTFESALFNNGHAVGDGDACQTAARVKGIRTDSGNGVTADLIRNGQCTGYRRTKVGNRCRAVGNGIGIITARQRRRRDVECAVRTERYCQYERHHDGTYFFEQ